MTHRIIRLNRIQLRDAPNVIYQQTPENRRHCLRAEKKILALKVVMTLNPCNAMPYHFVEVVKIRFSFTHV